MSKSGPALCELQPEILGVFWARARPDLPAFRGGPLRQTVGRPQKERRGKLPPGLAPRSPHGLPRRGGALPGAQGALRPPAQSARGCGRGSGSERRPARHRARQPPVRGRPVQELRGILGHAAQGVAEEGLGDPRGPRLRRFRPHHEYFLGAFARSEGRGGGEFFVPSCIVRLPVEIIEPYYGRILDSACGSCGMFVQSARFVAEHRKHPSAEPAICGQEKEAATMNPCRRNLPMHRLEGGFGRPSPTTRTCTPPRDAPTGRRLKSRP